jgi:hypothetical protein
VDPRKDPMIPVRARRKTTFQTTFPPREWARVPDKDVGRMMARLVPKAKCTMTSGWTCIAGKAQKVRRGIMIIPPPTPMNPLRKPTAVPIVKNWKIL